MERPYRPLIAESKGKRTLRLLAYYFTLPFLWMALAPVYGLRIKGRKYLRRCKAAVTAMNHCQYLEWFFMCHAAWPRAVRFSMEEANIRRKDIGWANRLMGGFGIPEDNPMAMAPMIGKLLNNGELVHFFPEGVLKYRNPVPDGLSVGAAWFACRYDVPLVPVTEVLIERPIRKFVPWWPPKVLIVIGKALNPGDFGGRERRIKDKARDMTSELLNIMQKTIARYGNGFPVYR